MQPFARLSRLHPALLLLSSCWFGEAQAQDDDFEQFRQQQQQAFEAFSDEFNEQYQAFVAAERAAFEQFKAAVEQRWSDYVGSTSKDWVEYGQDLSRRGRVDLAQGQAAVEVLVESGEEQARAALQKAIVELDRQ